MYGFLNNRGKSERSVANAVGTNSISLKLSGWNLASAPRVPGWAYTEAWNYGISLCPQRSLQEA